MTEHNAHKTKKPEAIFVFRANSTMAPRNSMRTKTLFSKEGKFWSKIRPKWPNPRGVYNRSLWGVEPRTKAICKVETTKDIVDGLIDFYNLVFYFI